MSRGERLSILGMFEMNQDLFDGLVLPTQLDANDFISNLFFECAELEMVYTNPEWMQFMIGAWCNKNIHSWQRMADVLYENYDPFINLKRDEMRTITETHDLALNVTRDLANGNTQTNNVNAWDDTSTSGVLRNSVTDSGTDTGTVDTTDTGTITTTDEFHMTGDSAITDAQDVAVKEIKLRADYNMYNIIIRDFQKRFCIMLY